jgi:hypothetical protein
MEVAFLEEHDPALGVGIIGTLWGVVGRDGQVDEGLDDGVGGIGGGELTEVMAGFEVKHESYSYRGDR